MRSWIAAIFLTLLTLVGFEGRSFGASSSERFDAAQYGGEYYNDWRQITYWGRVSLSVRDYEYGSGDSESLKLAVKDKTSPISSEKPRDDIQKHFLTEFKRLFGDLPFHDLDKEREKREEQFRRDNPNLDYLRNPNVDAIQALEAFQAAELARRKALYGGRAGALYCHVQIKRRAFPVLYHIACSLTAEEDLRYVSWRERRDIGFSTPEHVDKEIKQAITRMLEMQNVEFRKAKKYGQR